MSDREVAAMASMTEAHELLLIEEADAWFEYLEATRGQSALRYADLEPWAWARLRQRLRADLHAVGRGDPQDEPGLVHRQQWEIRTRHEDGGAHDRVPAGERLDEVVAHRLAQHGQPRGERRRRLAQSLSEGACQLVHREAFPGPSSNHVRREDVRHVPVEGGPGREADDRHAGAPRPLEDVLVGARGPAHEDEDHRRRAVERLGPDERGRIAVSTE